jgi:ectoine hydroxylase-related dioxygenase (phytanoyl-CoA dioxygenase family)
VKGRQIASVWIALDRVDRSNGAVEFIAGSHKWGVNFRPTPFRKGHEMKFTSSDLAAIPDIDADRSKYDIRWWEMEAGDCLVFHAMIVHGAPGNLTPGARRRGLALRYTGDDVRYDPRPGTFQFPHTPDLAAGQPMSCELFPKVWP